MADIVGVATWRPFNGAGISRDNSIVSASLAFRLHLRVGFVAPRKKKNYSSH